MSHVPDPVRITEDYFLSEAQMLTALGLKPGTGFVTDVKRKTGTVYGAQGKKLGTYTFEGWQVTVVRV